MFSHVKGQVTKWPSIYRAKTYSQRYSLYLYLRTLRKTTFFNLLLNFYFFFRRYCCKNPKVSESENLQNKKNPPCNQKNYCVNYKWRVIWNNTSSLLKKNECCLIEYRIIQSRFEMFVDVCYLDCFQ